jgi:hypothetical protein
MRGFFNAITALAVLLCLAAGARAVEPGSFAAGDEAAKHGNYGKAVDIWTPLAEAGEAKAQTALAGMYAAGLGVEPDFTKARKWFRKAARQGDPEAAMGLGALYARGLGVDDDLPLVGHAHDHVRAQRAAFGAHALLFVKITVLGHAGQFGQALERHLTPLAPHFRAAQGRDQVVRFALQFDLGFGHGLQVLAQ